MKKKIVDLEARCWSGSEVHSGVELLETFFQFNDPATAREMLNKIVISAVKKKSVLVSQDAAAVFHFYLALRSFIRACFLISKKRKKWTVEEYLENRPVIINGNFSEEYRDPVQVFRKAFKAYRRKEYEGFLSSAVYFSLSDSGCEEERRIIGPYVHLVKMLEAAYLMVERAGKE